MIDITAKDSMLIIDGWDNNKIKCWCPCDRPDVDVLTLYMNISANIIGHLITGDIKYIHMPMHKGLNSEYGKIESVVCESNPKKVVITYRYIGTKSPINDSAPSNFDDAFGGMW